MLPKPKHKYGYTNEQIDEICRGHGITREQFGKAFGVNTVTRDPKMGTIYYVRDVERALHRLECKDGKFHDWD